MKHLLRAGCIVIVSIANNVYAHANTEDTTRLRRWYFPHYVPVQFAGNIGLISTGVGYSSAKQTYSFDLMYGYVPRSVGGSYIHTISAKNYFPFGQYALNSSRSIIPYIGLGVSVEVSGNAFFRQPKHFPEAYYRFPKNLHALLYGGARLQHLFDDDASLRGVEFYAEAGTIDLYIWYKAMSHEISFREIFSLALGVNLLLDK